MTAWLDTGAFIAVERRDRQVGAKLRVLQLARIPLKTSAAVVAQVWRDGSRQANLARILSGVAVLPLEAADARRTGELLAAAATQDVVDAHLVLHVVPGDYVLTSDPEDIEHLLDVRTVKAEVTPV